MFKFPTVAVLLFITPFRSVITQLIHRNSDVGHICIYNYNVLYPLDELLTLYLYMTLFLSHVIVFEFQSILSGMNYSYPCSLSVHLQVGDVRCTAEVASLR